MGELLERRMGRIPGDGEGEGGLTVAVEELDRTVRFVGGGPLVDVDTVLAVAIGRPVVGPQVVVAAAVGVPGAESEAALGRGEGVPDLSVLPASLAPDLVLGGGRFQMPLADPAGVQAVRGHHRGPALRIRAEPHPCEGGRRVDVERDAVLPRGLTGDQHRAVRAAHGVRADRRRAPDASRGELVQMRGRHGITIGLHALRPELVGDQEHQVRHLPIPTVRPSVRRRLTKRNMISIGSTTMQMPAKSPPQSAPE